MTYDDTLKQYAHLYKNTRYGYEPRDLARACELVQFMDKKLNPGQTLLDCSAGRGILGKLITPYGIQYTATEADPWLITHELKDYDPRFLRYSQLAELQPQKWDAVVSLNVLQTLLSEDDIRQALREMATLSSDWLCVSVEFLPQQWVNDDGTLIDFTCHRQPPAWWLAEIAEVATVITEYQHYATYYVMAEV